jgi:hypothetical protein
MRNTTFIKSKRVIVGMAGLGVVAALGACSGVTASIDPAAAPVAPPTTQGASAPATTAASTPDAPAAAPESDGPIKMVIGKPITITQYDQQIGTIAVTSIKQVKPSNQFIAEAKHGAYWVVNVTYQATAKGMAPLSWDWKVKDGQGQEFDETCCIVDEPNLPSGELHVGEKATGTISFDAPKSGAHLIYKPMFSGASLATIPLVAS